MRTSRSAAVAGRVLLPGLVLVVLLAGCGSGDGNAAGAGSAGSAASGTNVAGSLALAGPADCRTGPLCLTGFQQTYGLTFREFKPVDPAGPSAASLVARNDAQIAVVRTNDADAAGNLVLLADDKHLEPPDNVTPVIALPVSSAYGEGLTDAVDAVSTKLTTQDLAALDRSVAVDKKDADAAAKSWLTSHGLLPSGAAAKTGPRIVVGSADSTESDILADLYADALEANGYPVAKKLRVGPRDVYFPAVTRGELGLVPDYAGSLLTYLDPSQTAGDADATAEVLDRTLESQPAIALPGSPAQDPVTLAVSRDTAAKYDLKTISDLAKPAT
jgi:osmoprotectant transport system substrate-binding protein